MDAPEYTTKRCTKCGNEYPATVEFFRETKGLKRGLRANCKQCDANYRLENRERRNAYNREYQKRNREAIIERYQLRRNRAVMLKREYNKRNKERIYIKNREYREQHREQIAEAKRRYRKLKPHIGKAIRQRARARKRSLPNTFTGQHWLLCLEYWHYCCAVCGSQLRGLFDIEPHADHWRPLSKPGCLGTVPGNMICLCSECNLSKNDKDPEQWLAECYGKRKTADILRRIQAYFEWIKQQ